MKKTLLINILAAVICLLYSCSDIDAPDNRVPVVSVADATDITRTSAILHGTVQARQGSSQPTLCFEYSTDGGEKHERPVNIDGDGTASVALSDLKAGTLYHYRLVARRGKTQIASDSRAFRTVSCEKPKLAEPMILSQGPASVIASVTVEDDGGEPLSHVGCRVRNTADGTITEHQMPETITVGIPVKISVSNLPRHATLEMVFFACNAIGETEATPLTVVTRDAITLNEAGELSMLMGDDKNLYENIAISGKLNGDDMRHLRQLTIRSIDLTDARIVEGGGAYFDSRYTESDVIGYGMFSGLNMLKEISLPNSVVRIERQAFQDCISLKKLTIPASVSALLPSDGCKGLEEILVSEANENFKSHDGVLYDAAGEVIVWFPIAKSGSLTLPSTLKQVADYAFRDSHIESIVFPDNITAIGQGVLSNSQVREVTLPNTLKLLSQAIFQGCYHLTTVRTGEALEMITDYAFDGAPLTHLYISAEIPPVCSTNALTSDGYNLFNLCTLHVPAQSKAWYQNHSVWGRFSKIVGM